MSNDDLMATIRERERKVARRLSANMVRQFAQFALEEQSTRYGWTVDLPALAKDLNELADRIENLS